MKLNIFKFTIFYIITLLCVSNHALFGQGGLLTKKMTSNTTPAPFVVTTTSELLEMYKGYLAFSGTLPNGGFWVTGDTFVGPNYTGSQSITIYLGASCILTNYSLATLGGGYVDHATFPRDWHVSVSQDGNNYIEVNRQTNVDAPTFSGQTYSFNVPTTSQIAGSYVRITITRTRGRVAAIDKILLYGIRSDEDYDYGGGGSSNGGGGTTHNNSDWSRYKIDIYGVVNPETGDPYLAVVVSTKNNSVFGTLRVPPRAAEQDPSEWENILSKRLDNFIEKLIAKLDRLDRKEEEGEEEEEEEYEEFEFVFDDKAPSVGAFDKWMQGLYKKWEEKEKKKKEAMQNNNGTDEEYAKEGGNKDGNKPNEKPVSGGSGSEDYPKESTNNSESGNTVIRHYDDRDVTTYPDGSRTINYHDGRRTEIDKDGNYIDYDASGKKVNEGKIVEIEPCKVVATNDEPYSITILIKRDTFGKLSFSDLDLPDILAGMDLSNMFCLSPNPFTIDGNAMREITDLSMTGSDPLLWIRHNNSIPRVIVPAFGQGASWRHNWQYELQAASNDQGDHLLFIYPEGVRRTFHRQGGGSFATLHERYKERARLVGDNVEITTQEEDTLLFEPAPAPVSQVTSGIYRVITLTNKNGQVTRFDYNADGLLHQITNEAENQITIYYEQFGNIPCISRVETSDGRAVDYEYRSMGFQPMNSNEEQHYITLAHARYGDSTSATYKYDFLPTGTTPLLVEADDPRFDGQGRHIGYRYHTAHGHGVLHAEFNPVTKQDYATLEFDPADPEKRIVRYTDDRTITYRVPKNTNGRPTERTDSLGRTETWTYAYGGEESLVEQTQIDGKIFKYTRDKNGYVTRIENSDGLVVDIEYDKNGKIAKTKDNRGRTSEFTRDSKGRITQASNTKIKTNNGNGNNGSNGNSNSANPGNGNANPNSQIVPGQIKKQQSFTYDSAGHLLRQEHDDGTYEEYTRNNKGHITATRDRNGRQRHYTHAERGLIASETNPAGETTHYNYNPHGHPASRTDALGHVTTWERDERGLVTKQTNPDGTTRLYSYDKYGRKTTETDEIGRTASWEYDNLGRLTRLTDFAGGATQFDYTETPGGCGTCSLIANPSRIEHPDGRIDNFLYDSEGRLLMQSIAVGTPHMATTLFAYDDADNLTRQTNPDGGIITHTYDTDKNRLTTTDPLGRVTSWTYDDEGRTLSVTEPSGRRTDFAYDLDGNLIYTVAPDGSETLHEYDASNRRIATTDALGNTTRWNYDPNNGNLLSTTDAAGGKTIHDYDKAGRRTRTTFPDKTTQTWSYDTLRISKTLTPDGLEVVNEYNNMRRLISTTGTPKKGSQPAATTRTTYDDAGRRVTVTDPLNRTTTYDYNTRNQVTVTTHPDGTQTRNEYDDAGRLTAKIDQLGNVTTYTYNALGAMDTLTDANGNTTTFEYDNMNRKTAMVYPDGTSELWAYNLDGSIATYTTRAGQTKTITYNLDGNPLTETWVGASLATLALVIPPDVTYTYDDTTGRLLSVDNGKALLTYTHDKLGRILTETTTINSTLANVLPHTVTYHYDARGRKSGLTYPDGRKVTYTHDSQGRMTEVYNGNKKPLATYEYDAFRRRSKLTRYNGTVTNYSYDQAGQTLSINHLGQGNKALAFAVYEYDNMGRRTSMTRESLQPTRYSYGATGQLTGVDYGHGSAVVPPASNGNGNNGNGNGSGGTGSLPAGLGNMGSLPMSEFFTYDPLGNRLEHTNISPDGDSTITQYEVNNLNQYTHTLTANGATKAADLTYDPNGNLVADGKQHYTYDAQNRLIEVESATTKAVFTYDAKNRCILRQYFTLNTDGHWLIDETNSLVLTYDTSWNLIADRAISGTQKSLYIHGNRVDEILANIQTAKTYYPHGDALGSVIAFSDDNGKIESDVYYTAYGLPINAPANHRFLYTGREWLAGIGLSDHRNRYYSPSSGRWLSKDSIYYGDGPNLYTYAHNFPVGLADPLGTMSCKECDELAKKVISGDFGARPGILHSKKRAEYDALISKMQPYVNKIREIQSLMSINDCVDEPKVKCSARPASQSNNDRNLDKALYSDGNITLYHVSFDYSQHSLGQSLVHEYVHALDDCRNQNIFGDPIKRACSEIRARSNSNYCNHPNNPVLQKQCVINGAVGSLTVNRTTGALLGGLTREVLENLYDYGDNSADGLGPCTELDP